MSCTIEKIIADARMLVNRLKDHDNAADNVIGQATILHKRVEAMKIVSKFLKFINARYETSRESCDFSTFVVFTN